MQFSLGPLLWFAAVVALIPLALWLLKRTPMGGGATQGLLRSVAVLPLSPGQRIVTVEVGQGEERRWLVLGITPQSITTLHSMAPQAESAQQIGADSVTPGFGQLLHRLRHDKAPAAPTAQGIDR